MTVAPRTGLIVGAHGRHYLVEQADGTRLRCHARGKRTEGVVGDRLTWSPSGDEGVIESVIDRRNLFYRQDAWRCKRFAANLDRLMVLVAVEPAHSEQQLARALIAAEDAGIPAFVVLNKIDKAGADDARQRLAPYRAMGMDVVEVTLKHDPDGARRLLAPQLDRGATLVIGPSGAGKSTLINRLVPHAGAQVGEISQALNAGRHTTTTTTWYWLDAARGGALIDSPGFQEFGLHHVAATALAGLMPDLRRHAGDCRFHDCSHRHEPGCGVLAARDRGAIDAQRYRVYEILYDELASAVR